MELLKKNNYPKNYDPYIPTYYKDIITNHHYVIYVRKLMKQSSMLFTNVKIEKKYGKHLNQ